MIGISDQFIAVVVSSHVHILGQLVRSEVCTLDAKRRRKRKKERKKNGIVSSYPRTNMPRVHVPLLQ